jgi:hypothetical protein
MFTELRRFVDSSKFILKVVLRHDGSIHPSVPFAHSVHKREAYENMNLVLKAVSCFNYEWKICGEFNGFGGLVVSVLASGTQDRGFKASRSRLIFRAKIHSVPSFGGKVKPFVPCRTLSAC